LIAQIPPNIERHYITVAHWLNYYNDENEI